MLAPSGTRRWDWRAISLRLWFVLVVGTGVVIPAVAFDNLKIIPKIQLALLLPFCLMAGRHYRTLGSMAVTAILLQLMGIVLAGPTSVLAFLGDSPKILGVVVTRLELLARLPTVYSLLIGAGTKPASAMV